MGLEYVDVLEGLGLKSEQGSSEVKSTPTRPIWWEGREIAESTRS